MHYRCPRHNILIKKVYNTNYILCYQRLIELGVNGAVLNAGGQTPVIISQSPHQEWWRHNAGPRLIHAPYITGARRTSPSACQPLSPAPSSVSSFPDQSTALILWPDDLETSLSPINPVGPTLAWFPAQWRQHTGREDQSDPSPTLTKYLQRNWFSTTIICLHFQPVNFVATELEPQRINWTGIHQHLLMYLRSTHFSLLQRNWTYHCTGTEFNLSLLTSRLNTTDNELCCITGPILQRPFFTVSVLALFITIDPQRHYITDPVIWQPFFYIAFSLIFHDRHRITPYQRKYYSTISRLYLCLSELLSDDTSLS